MYKINYNKLSFFKENSVENQSNGTIHIIPCAFLELTYASKMNTFQWGLLKHHSIWP